MLKNRKLYICFSIVFLLLGKMAIAQQLRGSIISDGEYLAGARIEVVSQNLGAVSGDSGVFVIDPLPAGTYELRISLPGFRTLNKEVSVPADDLKITLQPDVFKMEAVVVSATRNEQVRKEAPIIVNIIDDRLFEATQSVSLAEGLNFQPGLRMETNCQNCGFSQLRMNGLEGAYSQILIDGRPVFSALNGIYGLEQIPASIIDRVEVVRGGASALYGSNAIGGTVNIITRDPIENDLQVGFYQGWTGLSAPDQMVNFNGSLVSKDQKWGATLYGVTRHRKEYDHNEDGFSEMTRLRSYSLGSKLFFKPNRFTKFTGEVYGTSEYRRGGNLLDLPPHEADIAEELKTLLGGGGFTFERYSQDLNSKFSAYLSMLNTQMDNYYGAGKDPLGYGETEDMTWVAGTQFVQNLNDFPVGKAILTVGMEYKSDKMLDQKPGYGLFVDQHLQLLGLYGQHEWMVHEKLKWLTGVRLDYNNLTGRVIANPRLNLLADLTSSLQFRAGYAKGFRAPQVFTEDVHVELVAGEVQAIRLGDDLRSERSDSWTASLDFSREWRNSQLNITLEGFITRIGNAFVLEESSDDSLFILEKRNGSAAMVQGGNLEVRFAPSPTIALQGGFTLQTAGYAEPVVWSADVSAADLTNQMLRSPNAYGNFMATWAPDSRFSMSFSGVYTGPMLAPHFAGYIPEDRLEKTPGFMELNIKFNYDWDPGDKWGIRFTTGMQNLLNSYQSDFDIGPDRDASYVYGPSRPRTVFVGAKFHLE